MRLKAVVSAPSSSCESTAICAPKRPSPISVVAAAMRAIGWVNRRVAASAASKVASKASKVTKPRISTKVVFSAPRWKRSCA